MEFKYFKLIKTIEEEGNIANSSKKLFLTQSAISHQLKELEERLGFKVFIRSRNKWILTPEGMELYQLGNSIIEQLENKLQYIQRLRNASKGRIRLSTECYSFYHGLSKFIQKMGLLYPEISIELAVEATHKPLAKILAKEIDIAIVTSVPNDPKLSSICVYEDELFVIMHPENPLHALNQMDAIHFRDVHLIIHSFPLETVSICQLLLTPKNILPKKISAIPLTEVALEMVYANMGVICMPKWALSSFKLPANIVFKKIGEKGLKRKHYIVFRKEDASKKYLHDFILNIREDFLQN